MEGRQQQIILRMEALAAAVESLQQGFERDRADRLANSYANRTEQDLQLQAVQAQIAGLQLQVADNTRVTAVVPVAPKTVETKAVGTKQPPPTSGDWVVNVASSSKQDAIKALQDRLKQQEIHTELQRTDVQGKTRYRLRVTGFTTGAEARQYAARLAEQADLQGAWASRR